MTARRLTVIGSLALCLCGAGCGRSQDRADATGVAERFFAAIASGDGAGACAELSSDTRKALEQDEQKPCRDAIGGLRIEPGAVTAIRLYLTNAQADLDNGDRAFLSQTRQGWRLSAAGCKPAEGDPADTPMDCELEA